MANSFRNEVYRSPKLLTYIAVGLFGVLIFFSILYILFSFGAIFFPDSAIELDNGEFMSVGYILIGVVALLHIPTAIATIVFFLIWEYRVYSNLSALMAQNLEFSPGWAVGWWFIPFANLVKPFQVMREIWVESDPEYEAEFGFLSSNLSAPTIMGFWWAFWLLYGFTDRIAGKMDDSPYFPTAMIVSSIFSIAAASLLIIIILNIFKRQELRFQRVGNLQTAAPPPPPTFS